MAIDLQREPTQQALIRVNAIRRAFLSAIEIRVMRGA
jgi:hypothetical protein